MKKKLEIKSVKLKEMLDAKVAPLVKQYGNEIDTLADIDEFSAVVAEAAQELYNKRKDMSSEEYLEAQKELHVLEMQIDKPGRATKFDEAMEASQNPDNRRQIANAYRIASSIVQNRIKKMNEFSEMQAAGKTPEPTNHSTQNMIDLLNHSALVQNLVKQQLGARRFNAPETIAVSDVNPDRSIYTFPMPTYIINPLSVLNVIPKHSVTNATLRDIQNDTSKEEGAAAAVAEGVAFSKVDYGTKEVERPLRWIGAYTVVRDEWTSDSERAYMLPYTNMRLLEDFLLVVEGQLVRGAGTAPNIQGFLTETGVTKLTTGGGSPTGTPAGDWTEVHINAFADGLGHIWNGLKDPTGTMIFLNPLDYVKALKAFKAEIGWLLSQQASGAGTAPGGIAIPTLFGMPLVPSFAINEKEPLVANLSHTYMLMNGGQSNRFEGTINDQLIKRERTIGLFARVQQFSRYPALQFYQATQR